MKKLLLTAPSFTGYVEVIYGSKNELLMLDFSSARIEHNQVNWLKTKVPVVFAHIQAFKEALMSPNITVVEEKFDFDFEKDFWSKYGVKRNRDRCLAIWNKMTNADKALAVYGIKTYNRHLSTLNWNKSKSDPENYLKKKYWLNEWE